MSEPEAQPETQPETQPESEPEGLTFSMEPVEKKPKREYRKGSKYDNILDQFIESKEKLVSVTIPDKDGNYIRTQLNKRILARNLKKIDVSVANNICYLERK